MRPWLVVDALLLRMAFFHLFPRSWLVVGTLLLGMAVFHCLPRVVRGVCPKSSGGCFLVQYRVRRTLLEGILFFHVFRDGCRHFFGPLFGLMTWLWGCFRCFLGFLCWVFAVVFLTVLNKVAW